MHGRFADNRKERLRQGLNQTGRVLFLTREPIPRNERIKSTARNSRDTQYCFARGPALALDGCDDGNQPAGTEHADRG
jgi:hypothetical protein